MEAEVFAEIKNVEKLLTLLSASNTAPRDEDNEEISKLYHQTLAIRPKLIKLIEKYSQKKDDFTQLNEKFIKARRDYEALLESSMSHPPQHNYQQYAMRPGPPSQGYPPPAGVYPSHGAPPQDPNQRYYTPGPNDRPSFAAASPSPNYAPPTGPPGSAPYYPSGSEPSQPGAQHIGGNAPPSATSPAQFSSYAQPPPPQHDPYGQGPGGPLRRPDSTYGAQELSTSVYDSPIAPHNPQSAGGYTQSNYSQEDVSHGSGPSNPYGQQNPYQSYNPLGSNPPSHAPPGPPSDPSAPPPQNAGGPYDSRHNLPSQNAVGGAPQYKPYAPPGPDADGPSAPAPNDYYRSSNVY
jgi:signal transducing adaptor molecule